MRDWRRLVHTMRTEGSGPGRESAAIGLGVFIGCLPLYGLHLFMCIAAGWLLRLNRLKLYLASYVANPFVAPWLLLAELQAGSWLRRGDVHQVSVDTLETTGIVVLGADLFVGSLVVGGSLGAAAALGTWTMHRRGTGDDTFDGLVCRAADRYAAASITAFEFARGKLRHDPVFRAVLTDGLLRTLSSSGGGTLLDVGCGQGVMLALLAEARRTTGRASDAASLPYFERMIGIDVRPRVTELARAALGGDAEILTGDARTASLPPADVVLVFDVLHMMGEGEQAALLRSLAARLRPGGVMLVREADASAGWRFTAVRLGNRLKALAAGELRQPFHFRTVDSWLALFGELGLHADVRPMGRGTPFGNVLFRVTAASPPSLHPR